MFRQYNVYPSVCFHYVANVYLIKMQLPFMIWGNFISSYTQIDKIDYNRDTGPKLENLIVVLN